MKQTLNQLIAPVFTRHEGSVIQILSFDKTTCAIWHIISARRENINISDLALTKITTSVFDVDSPSEEHTLAANQILQDSNFPVLVNT